MAGRAFTWHDLHPDYGVLKLYERAERRYPVIELHVAVDPETGGSLAWWQTANNDWLIHVVAGEV